MKVFATSEYHLLMMLFRLLVLVLSLFGRKLFPFNYLIVAFVGGACETSLAKIMLVLASLGLSGLCVVTFSSS